jgi:hypothetical protein
MVSGSDKRRRHPDGAQLRQNDKHGTVQRPTKAEEELDVDVSRTALSGVKDSRELTRSLIVICLFTMLAATIGSAICSAFLHGSAWTRIESLLNLVFPAETALIGTAVAFYMTN